MLDQNFINKIVTPKGDTLNVRSLPGTTSKVLLTLSKGSPAGRTSGEVINMKDGKWLQVNLYKETSGKTVGYVRSDVVILSVVNDSSKNSVAEANGKSMMDELISNDQQLFTEIIISKQLLKEAKAKGKNVADLSARLDKLNNSYVDRQVKIKTSNLIKFQTGYKKEMASLVKAWDETKTYDRIIDGIGAVPIVVWYLMGAATLAAIYYAFRPDYDQSKVDLNISDDIKKKIKSVLTADEYSTFEAKLKTQVADAYKDGMTEGKFGGIFTIVKWVAVFIGGYFVVDKFIVTQNRKRTA